MLEADLIIAGFAIAIVSVLSFLAGRRVYAEGKILFFGSILFVLVFGFCFSGNLSWAKVIPSSASVLWSNFLPVCLAFAAGVAFNAPGLGRVSRPVTIASLSILAVVCLLIPISRPAAFPPVVDSIGVNDGVVVMQTHDSTCAPAAAATLLRLNGIEATEHEMLGPCLTSNQGTEALGLYRGLKIASNRSGADVRISDSDPSYWFRNQQLPSIALVNFSANATHSVFDRLKAHWLAGSQETRSHAVVVMGREKKKWIVADPAVGLVRWSDQELRSRFTGDALHLCSRKRN